MPWVDAEVAVSLEVMADLLCTTYVCLPLFEPSCERYDDLASVFISMSPLYMCLQVGKWPEILNKAIIWCSPSDCWHAMHLQKPSDVCFNPSEGTFYHSLRHARKDLLSK